MIASYLSRRGTARMWSSLRRTRWLTGLLLGTCVAAHVALWNGLPQTPRCVLGAAAGSRLLGFTADGTAILTAVYRNDPGAPFGYTVQCWDARTGREVPPAAAGPPECRWRLNDLAGEAKLQVIDCVTGACEVFDTDVRGGPGNGSALALQRPAVSPDQRTLAYLRRPDAGGPMALVVRDLTGQREPLVIADATGPVAFSPDGRTLAEGRTAGDPLLATPPVLTGPIRLRDVATGAVTGELPAPPFNLHQLAFSPDGRMLAGCGWSMAAAGQPSARIAVQVWDVASGRSHEIVAGHYTIVPNRFWYRAPSLTWLADGRLLTVLNPALALSSDIGIWDPVNGLNRLVELPHESSHLSYDPVASADGRRLFLTSRSDAPYPPDIVRQLRAWLGTRIYDGPSWLCDVQVIDSVTGRELFRCPVHHAAPQGTLSPDGRTAVTFEHIGQLHVWDVPPPAPAGPFLAVLTAELALATAIIAWRRRSKFARRTPVTAPASNTN
jgi:WD40 repeat protein